MPADLIDHYRRRAPEYEAIYFRPDEERLYELEELARALRGWLAGRDVLEVAAGTGWWTVHAASVAKSVVATDANEDMLAIAKQKPLDDVRFLVADAYALEKIPGKFDGFVSNFWLSHVPRARVPEFLDSVRRRLEPGGRVFMADNVFIEGFGGRFMQEPGNQDTYRMRKDKEGNEHQVLKNYYTEDELRRLLEGMVNVQIHMGRCYWWIMYETPASDKTA